MRLLNNWIDSYMLYLENTEPAVRFHRWTAISVILGTLRKKVHLELGRIKVFPNLYIVFVAEPGIARKSQAISFGLRFLREIPDVVCSAEAITKEALLCDLEASATDEAMPDGSIYKHCSLNITSKEFETFIGQKKDNTKMIVLLTDLYDAEELPWKYRTKNSGSNVIPSVFINLLAATTPDSLASCLPATAIGGGLTSRILFVWASRKAKKVPRPFETDQERSLGEQLQKDLYVISRIAGSYTFTPESATWWDNWYQEYDESDPHRRCKDRAFSSWYSRKPMMILKTAMACSAAETSHLTMEVPYLERAIEYIEELEEDMTKAFRGVGKSDIASEVSLVMQEVRYRGRLHKTELARVMIRDLDSASQQRVIDTVLSTGEFIMTTDASGQYLELKRRKK